MTLRSPGPRRLLPAFVILLLVLIGAARPAPSASVEAAAALTWQRCGALECTTLGVPLDYNNPASRQIELALIRQPAREPSRRIGSVLVNPGGPGGSGVDFVRAVAAGFPREVQNRFDIVGWDPRGVGASTPLLCHDNIEELTRLDPSPDSAAEEDAIVRENRELVDLCVARGDGRLPFMGTESTVRDLEQIRLAVGDRGLTYVGFSYGTVIGQLYAELFPQNARALVLDGAVDLSLNAEDFAVQQIRAFEGAFDRFVQDCRETRCLPSDKGDPDAAVTELLRRAEATPIPSATADRPAGPAEVVLAIFSALYSEGQWPKLARAIDDGLDGDGSGLAGLMDEYLRRHRDGTYDNWYEVYTAVSCLDTDVPRDLEAYRQLIDSVESRLGRFADTTFGSWLPCVYWPVPAQPLQAPDGAGAPPILVIGTTGDPATPYAWAVSLSQQLESATLLTFNGEGHTAFLSSQCVNEAVTRYLVDLTVPAEGTVCGTGNPTPIDIADDRPRAPEATPVPPQSPSTDNSAPEAPADDAPSSVRDDDASEGRMLTVVLIALVVTAIGVAVVLLWLRRRSRRT